MCGMFADIVVGALIDTQTQIHLLLLENSQIEQKVHRFIKKMHICIHSQNLEMN